MPLSRIFYRAALCILGAALLQLAISLAFSQTGVEFDGGGLGGILWGLHAPARIALCSALDRCEGYGHFVLTDDWGPGPQLPDTHDLLLVGSVNALFLAALLLLAWYAVLERIARKPRTSQSAVAAARAPSPRDDGSRPA